MKRFIHVNNAFACEVCGHENPPAEQTCRNHCRHCLNSKHVDKNPGDRQEECGGVMKPIDIEIQSGNMKSIIFKCQKCGIVRKNKIAIDDAREKLLEMVEKNADLR